jgi:formylglycine-generating enzyme required for sulfatase activity
MRAGSSRTRYPWGNAPEREGKLALNFWQGTSHKSNLRTDGYVYVSPVTAFPPNAWGIFDPVGNAWQWTLDYYAPDTYARAAEHAPVTDPTGPDTGKTRVLRGGSWWCGACTCEGNGLFYRGKGDPEAPFNNNGFRCVRTIPATKASSPEGARSP